jgi:ankyrin repeat protein
LEPSITRLPLFQAIIKGDARQVQELVLFHDIYVNAVSEDGRTALMVACSTLVGKHLEVVKLLLSARADPHYIFLTDN